MTIKQDITDYITTNGSSARVDIIDSCVAGKEIQRHEVLAIIQRMQRKNNLVKAGDNYSLPA